MNEKIKETILDSLYERLSTMKDKHRISELMLESRINLANRGHLPSIRARAQNEIPGLETLARQCQTNVVNIEEAIAEIEAIVCK